jgi:hypothetical protein
MDGLFPKVFQRFVIALLLKSGEIESIHGEYLYHELPIIFQEHDSCGQIESLLSFVWLDQSSIGSFSSLVQFKLNLPAP